MILEITAILTVVTVLAAIRLEDLLHTVILLGGADILLALAFFLLSAPDVAITQAAIGSGLNTLIFIIAVFKTQRLEE